MDDDDLSYLSPSFDLSSLTIPRLRSILVSHDVSYPASAKKSQLIEIMRSQVLPNAARIIRQRDRIRRTSAGIMNARSNQELLDEEQRTSRSKDLDNDDNDDDHGHGHVVGNVPATPATAGRKKRNVGSRSSTARASTVENSNDSDSFVTELNPSLSFSTRKKISTRQSTINSDVGDVAADTPRRASATPARTPKVSATPSLRSSRRSRSRQSDLVSSSTNDIDNDDDESTFIAPRTPAAAKSPGTTIKRETRSSSIVMPVESDIATPREPTPLRSPAASRTPAA
ncbi:inner nuclear membrane protein enriched at telomere/subtelomere region, partial [Ascosphaera aggregata]